MRQPPLTKTVIASIALLLLAQSSFAAMPAVQRVFVCRSVEFAELQQASAKELKKRYCDSDWKEQHWDKALGISYESDYVDEQAKCSDQKERLGKIMAKKSIKVPACEGGEPK